MERQNICNSFLSLILLVHLTDPKLCQLYGALSLSVSCCVSIMKLPPSLPGKFLLIVLCSFYILSFEGLVFAASTLGSSP